MTTMPIINSKYRNVSEFITKFRYDWDSVLIIWFDISSMRKSTIRSNYAVNLFITDICESICIVSRYLRMIPHPYFVDKKLVCMLSSLLIVKMRRYIWPVTQADQLSRGVFHAFSLPDRVRFDQIRVLNWSGSPFSHILILYHFNAWVPKRYGSF